MMARIKKRRTTLKSHAPGDLIPRRRLKSAGQGQLKQSLTLALAACCITPRPLARHGCLCIELPLDGVVHVLEALAGDTSSLCSAACVSTTWRAAAATPTVWRIISMGGDHKRLSRRLCSDTFARLVGIAALGMSLREIDIGGCIHLIDRDLACLAQPQCPNLKVVCATPSPSSRYLNSFQLTGHGLVTALSGKELFSLKVQAIKYWPPLMADDYSAEDSEDDRTFLDEAMDSLSSLMASHCQLDVAFVCSNCYRCCVNGRAARRRA
jgi:hypothetical protein